MPRLSLLLLLVACSGLFFGACGEESVAGGGGEAASEGASDRPPPPGARRVPLAVTGQEVWITYRSTPEHARLGRRVGRSKEAAQKMALELYARVRKGEPIDRIARLYSNAAGAIADGFSGWWPVVPENSDSRDRALRAAKPGGLTPIIDWKGGFWFARRVDMESAKRLWVLFEVWRQKRVKLQVIYLVHTSVAKVYLGADAKVTRTKARTRKLADRLLAALREGADIGELSAQYSSQADLQKRKGMVSYFRGRDKPRDPWGAWGEVSMPTQVLQAAFDPKHPKGHIIDRVFDTYRGMYIVKVVDRID